MGSVVRLEGPIRPYAWGSHRFLAELDGRDVPSRRPEAERWFGDHPTAPSYARDADGSRVRLDELFAAAPDRWLGAGSGSGDRLPFLVKLLAAAAPLSLQVHPTREQAQAGFAREEALGIPFDAQHRVYSDPFGKPELLIAVTPVEALCGFRDPDQVRAIVDALGITALKELVQDVGCPVELVDRLLRSGEVTADVVSAIGTAGARVAAEYDGRATADQDVGDLSALGRWLELLARSYPADPGVAVAATMRLVRLRPGQAVHLPAGRMHAYLRGAGVEIMAPSDNVLRGGLTPKHVDIDELLRVLSPETEPTALVGVTGTGGELLRAVPGAPFRASELIPAGGTVRLDRYGPDVLVGVQGRLEVTADGCRCSVRPGEGVLIAASSRHVTVSGRGIAMRATTA